MGTLAGWEYRKPIVISHTGDGAQTNYQMKLSVVKGAGADSTGVVYLGNHALNWPTDILFTLSDGTTTAGADFWREESDATDGTWWLEANSIPAHPDDFHGYIYYGKLDASDASSGANTFIFFDHFDGDLSKWTGDTTKFTCSSSILVGNTVGAWYGIFGKTVNGQATFAWRGNFKYNRSGPNSQIFMGAKISGQGGAYFYGVNENDRQIGAADSGGGANTASNWTHNTYLTRDIKVIANTNSRFFESDSERSASPYTTKKPNSALIPAWCYYYSDSGNPFFCDWCLLRNYTATEPTWGTTGGEESLIGCIRSVPRIARIMAMGH